MTTDRTISVGNNVISLKEGLVGFDPELRCVSIMRILIGCVEPLKVEKKSKKVQHPLVGVSEHFILKRDIRNEQALGFVRMCYGSAVVSICHKWSKKGTIIN